MAIVIRHPKNNAVVAPSFLAFGISERQNNTRRITAFLFKANPLTVIPGTVLHDAPAHRVWKVIFRDVPPDNYDYLQVNFFDNQSAQIQARRSRNITVRGGYGAPQIDFPGQNEVICPDGFCAYGSIVGNTVTGASMNDGVNNPVDHDFCFQEDTFWCVQFPTIPENPAPDPTYTLTVYSTGGNSQQTGIRSAQGAC